MNKFYTLLFFSFLTQLAFSQSFTLRGFVSDQSNGERLISATIYDPQTKRGNYNQQLWVLQPDFTKGKLLISLFFCWLPDSGSRNQPSERYHRKF